MTIPIPPATTPAYPPLPARVEHKLGKQKAHPKQVKLAYDRYRKAILLPKIPATFGHYDRLIGQNLGVLGNDHYGDCVQAGAAHIVMLWYAERNAPVRFTRDNVLLDYSVSTGFVPNKPETDVGTDMSLFASYWRHNGILDGDGRKHRLAAYLRLDVNGLTEINEAAYFFGAVGIGVQLPETAQDQFNAGVPWDYIRGSNNAGGHFVPLVGFDGTYYYVVTWGRVHPVTPAFLRAYLDEALAYLSDDQVAGGLSIDGFDMGQLQTDLDIISGQAG